VIRRLLTLLIASTVLAGCVGPAGTTSQYKGKARRTPHDAISSLQTARLAVETSERGSMLGFPLRAILQDAEKDFGSVQQTFDSIHPPDTDRADDIRDRLDTILNDGSSTLADLRIASRRNNQATLLADAAKLQPTIDDLNGFLAELRQ
jgi:hypothetical protein